MLPCPALAIGAFAAASALVAFCTRAVAAAELADAATEAATSSSSAELSSRRAAEEGAAAPPTLEPCLNTLTLRGACEEVGCGSEAVAALAALVCSSCRRDSPPRVTCEASRVRRALAASCSAATEPSPPAAVVLLRGEGLFSNRTCLGTPRPRDGGVVPSCAAAADNAAPARPLLPPALERGCPDSALLALPIAHL
jgi:hypothetical protein